MSSKRRRSGSVLRVLPPPPLLPTNTRLCPRRPTLTILTPLLSHVVSTPRAGPRQPFMNRCKRERRYCIALRYLILPCFTLLYLALSSLTLLSFILPHDANKIVILKNNKHYFTFALISGKRKFNVKRFFFINSTHTHFKMLSGLAYNFCRKDILKISSFGILHI